MPVGDGISHACGRWHITCLWAMAYHITCLKWTMAYHMPEVDDVDMDFLKVTIKASLAFFGCFYEPKTQQIL